MEKNSISARTKIAEKPVINRKKKRRRKGRPVVITSNLHQPQKVPISLKNIKVIILSKKILSRSFNKYICAC